MTHRGRFAGKGGNLRSDCEADGRGGRIEAELTGLHPYAGVDLGEGISAWLAAGRGSGNL
ncbi:MAG: hypothetical protein F4X97_06725 [Boseongicola sp. SB0662_bin_57]|nr:hypothetical protein [Boseongicola sp. SB0662_bin_57]